MHIIGLIWNRPIVIVEVMASGILKCFSVEGADSGFMKSVLTAYDILCIVVTGML